VISDRQHTTGTVFAINLIQNQRVESQHFKHQGI